MTALAERGSWRAHRLGASHSLLRAGRLLFDAAVFGLIAPLTLLALFFTMFEIVFALSLLAGAIARALGAPASSALLLFAEQEQRQILVEMGAFTAALLAGAALLAFVVGAARAGRFWALALVLALAAGLGVIGAAPMEEPPQTRTLGALFAALRYGLPALMAAAALLVFAGEALRMGAAVGRRAHAWPRFSVSLYVARFGVRRRSYWLRLAGRLLMLAFKVTAMAAAFIALMLGLGALAVQALVSAGFVHELLGFYAVLVGMNLLLYAAVTALTLWSLRRNRATRLADIAVLVVCALALWDMSEAVGWSVRLMRETGTPFFASPFSEEELQILNLIALVWLFRSVASGVILREYDRLKQQTARSARELADSRPEQPVVFLRSFADDQQQVPSSDALLAHAFGAARSTRRLEDIVAEIMFARGPLVALANPAATAAPIGAARDVVADADWQAHVLGYIDASQSIVCFFGKTPSFLWEIDQVIARGKLDALMIVFPRDYPGERTLIAHAAKLAAMLGLRDEADERARMGGARVLVRDAAADQFEIIKSQGEGSFDYHEAIVRGAARLRLNAESAR